MDVRLITGCLLLGTMPSVSLDASDVLRLHPANPRYLEWRGKPQVIIGSGEHYGAVLNTEFDFARYLATLGRERLNHTRLFTGAAYVEPEGAFNIARNTLSPSAGRYLAPWARSEQPGYRGGGNRFDLNQWDPAYFERLRAFVETASRHDVIVEVNLFCPFYEDSQWVLSPFHPDNNVQGAGAGVARTQVYTLDQHGGLLTFQERFVREVVRHLKDYGNLYYEICNEPYFGGVTLDWQAHIAKLIADAQRDHPTPHLISQNIANHKARVDARKAHVDIYNFHYAAPPETVAMNWHLERPIGDNETGFRGTQDEPYRLEAWDFMLAGGALFSHLDYSFVAGHEDGTFAYPTSQPGGGTPSLRRSFRALRDFMEAFDFIRSRPEPDLRIDGLSEAHTSRALTVPGQSIAAYIRPTLSRAFSVRWTGHLDVPTAGEYTFFATSDDGLRLWIGDRLILDHGSKQGETEHRATLTLSAGIHPLKAEYFFEGGKASAKLAWTRPGGSREIVPASALRQPESTDRGLKGEYFLGRNFQLPWRSRSDAHIDFSWGERLPFDLSRTAPGAHCTLSPLPNGAWRARWILPLTGEVIAEERAQADGNSLKLKLPTFTDDIALRVDR